MKEKSPWSLAQAAVLAGLLPKRWQLAVQKWLVPPPVKTALRRDSIIGAGDVALVEQDVSLLNRGYVTEVEQVIGRKLTRATRTDQVLTPSMLQLAEAVRRGDQVVISARSGGINVRMQGEALSGGTLGQQISVRNLTSQRVIRARVAGPGQVEEIGRAHV